MLYCLIEPRLLSVGSDLAGKVTGMLLELSESEIAELISSEKARLSAVKDAIEVLQEAGDERAMTLVTKQPLRVDVQCAADMIASMRMSPRCSSMYSTRKLLASAGMGVVS